jgi:hypothetical protein
MITIATTVSQGLMVGDLIYIQQVYGIWNANGLRIVASAQLTTTFTITGISNNPIAAIKPTLLLVLSGKSRHTP